MLIQLLSRQVRKNVEEFKCYGCNRTPRKIVKKRWEDGSFLIRHYSTDCFHILGEHYATGKRNYEWPNRW